MKLGILVNTDSHLDHIIGLVSAAIERGHTVAMFAMDSGTRLLLNPKFAGLCGIKGVSMSFCEYSAQIENVGTTGLPSKIVRGSQYDNASMAHESDKVIVL